MSDLAEIKAKPKNSLAIHVCVTVISTWQGFQQVLDKNPSIGKPGNKNLDLTTDNPYWSSSSSSSRCCERNFRVIFPLHWTRNAIRQAGQVLDSCCCQRRGNISDNKKEGTITSPKMADLTARLYIFSPCRYVYRSRLFLGYSFGVCRLSSSCWANEQEE